MLLLNLMIQKKLSHGGNKLHLPMLNPTFFKHIHSKKVITFDVRTLTIKDEIRNKTLIQCINKNGIMASNNETTYMFKIVKGDL
jgi:uncharacterized ubiquitin-like protein YukD